MRQCQNCTDNLGMLRPCVQFGDIAFVDLGLVEGQLTESDEVGEAGSEVVK